MILKAIIFGSIGTLVETSELQRRAYNQAFENAGLDWFWEREAYQDMLTINGGQKRLHYYADKTSTSLSDAEIDGIHTNKSTIYQNMLRDEGIALREGVGQLVDAAIADGIQIAFASSTSEENIKAIRTALGDTDVFQKFTVWTHGGLVANSKPAPDIYLYVLSQLAVHPSDAIAIEDTATSMQSAHEAEVPCIAFPGANTQNQDFSGAVALADANQIADLAWVKLQSKTVSVL